MFGKKDHGSKIEYDPKVSEPVLKKSICTGETTAGLVDTATGRFHEMRLIANDADLRQFLKDCNVSKVRTIY